MSKSLASLSVRVGANISDFQTKMQQAVNSMKKAGDRMKQIGKNMSMYVTAPLAGLAALSMKAFNQQIQAENRLSASLRARGKDVQGLMGGYKAFAAEMQNLTNVGDETTLGLMAMAETMEAVDTKEAVKGAISLSNSLGMDLNAALRAVANAQQGNYQALQRYAPALKNATSEAEKAKIVQDLLASGFEQTKSQTEQGLGPLIALKNAVGDLSEQFGGIISEAINPFVKRLKDAVIVFQGLSDEKKRLIVLIASIAAALGPLLMGFGILIKSLALIKIGIAAIFSPVTLIIAAIAAIAAAFVYVYGNFQAFKERLSDWNWLRNAVIDVVKVMVKYMTMAFQPLLKLLGVDLWKEIDKLDQFKVEITQPLTAFKGFGETVKDVTKEVMSRLGMVKKETESTSEGFNAMSTSVGKAKQALMQLSSIGSTGMQIEGGTMEITDRARPDMTKFFDFVDERLDAMIARASHFTFMIGDALAAAMDQSLTSGENFFKVFGKMLLDIVKKLAAAAASAIILSIALSAVTGGAGNALTMLGGAAGGGFKDLFGALFGGMAGIPGMAQGGIVPPGFPNDTYPAFLSSGEKVVPSPIPLGGGGSGNINIRGNAIARGKDLLFTFQNADRDLIRRRGF